jgi:hypothetical protein
VILEKIEIIEIIETIETIEIIEIIEITGIIEIIETIEIIVTEIEIMAMREEIEKEEGIEEVIEDAHPKNRNRKILILMRDVK